jgi:hypothetical protein
MIRIAGAAMAAWLLAGSASAQTADELVAKNLAARGGAQALGALKSVAFDGKLIFPGGFELTYREVRTGAGNLRWDATIQGLTLVQAWDGKGAWRINPFEGRKDAEAMSGDEARAMADAASIPGQLLAARAAGASVAYLGTEELDGTLCHKLKVTQADGDEFVYLIDPDSNLEVKVTETRRIRGTLQVTENELGDYEAVGGVMFPMAIESGAPGSNQRQRLVIASATANPDAPASLFAQPVSPAK